METVVHVMRVYPVVIALTIAALVQMWKGTLHLLLHRQLDFQRFVQTGGMPSSHSASVAALTTAVAVTNGVRSLLFSVTLYFSLIVMYDATGLRRAAGRQAALLNRLMEQQPPGREVLEHRLWELLGHTPLEVFVGALLGIVYALAWYTF
jgi:acid phosphatase family membrane protein YuiD